MMSQLNLEECWCSKRLQKKYEGYKQSSKKWTGERVDGMLGSVQSLSSVRLFETPWIAERQASLSITNSRSSLRLRPSSQWCHPAISSSVVPFSSCPQSVPASESFPMSQLFAWGGQSTGVSALASFLLKNASVLYPYFHNLLPGLTLSW